MRRVYNYNTGKLYESDGTYTITVTEKALSPDVEVNPDDNGEIDQKYLSYDEAIDALDEIVDELCKNEGFNREDAEIVETDNGFCVTVPEYKQWCFVISGDVAESVNEEKKEEKKEESSEKNESVSTRFSKLREMFEAAGLNEEEDDEKKDDEKKDSDEDEKSDDEKKDDENGEEKDDEKKDSDDDDEEKEMKAIVITVKKGDEDKCKEELIEAGVADEDIEILDGEEDDENVDIRIDVNSVFELKDYLEKKGIDLEEEIGGEIVDDSDDENGDENSDDNNDENGEEGEEEAEFNFDDLGDLFGADEGDE